MAQTFSDNFDDGNLTGWNVVGSASNPGTNLRLQSADWSTDLVTYGTACDGVTQYIKASMVWTTGYPAYVLRFTDVDSPYYGIAIDSGPVWHWYRYASRGTGETEIGTSKSAATWESGDVVGITVVGTGSSTVVRLWHEPTANAPDAGGETWDSAAPTVSWTDDPGSAVDTGGYIGFAGASGTANYATFDNFYGGDAAAGGGEATGTGSLASQAASSSGVGILIAYPAWGYATPDAGEIAQSWSAWHLGAGAVVNGDADYGDLIIPPTVTCSSPIIDTGDAGSKQITMSSKYGTNLGTYTRYIRGSETLFAWDDGTPSWTEYTGAVTQAWRYVQVLLTGG